MTADSDDEKSVGYMSPEGWYEICEDCDTQIMFNWKPSRFEIHDRNLSRAEGDYAKGWVVMDSYDMIDFLFKSDFLAQYGYKIVEDKPQNKK